MRILIAPLNWGLGHATRCIPIIQQLLNDKHEVIIAADGYPLRLLQQEFPHLQYLELPSYSIHYSKGKSQIFAMLRSIPKIVYGIIREHHQLENIIQSHNIQQVISDNRFGLWNKRIESIYMTHQLMIKMPKCLKFLESVVWLIHRSFIHRYDQCWIPDYQGDDNLSGDLSHQYPLPKNAQFIGPLSRFNSYQNKEQPSSLDPFEVVAILSGPEPQRSLFEKQIIQRYFDADERCLIVRGLPDGSNAMEFLSANLAIVSHLDTSSLAYYLQNSQKIICRSGYSSIMDLEALSCLHKAELHPTPGQTEQEYLAKYLRRKLFF